MHKFKILKILLVIALSICLFLVIGVSKCQKVVEEAMTLEEESGGEELETTTEESGEEVTTEEEVTMEVTIYDITFHSNLEGPSIQDKSGYAIYACMLDGSQLTKIFDSGTGDFDPSWNSNHTQIAFSSYVDGDDDADIYIYNLETGEVSKIADLEGNDSLPDFGPNDNSVTFEHYQDPDDSEIYTVDTNGGNPVQLTDDSYNNTYPHFSPDEAQITFTSNRNVKYKIYSMNPDGTNVIQLTNFGNYDDFDGFYSSGGQYIVYTSNRSGNHDIYALPVVEDPDLQLEISMGAAVNLTDNPASDSSPDLSPDEANMVFTSDRDSANYNLDIYSMPFAPDNGAMPATSISGSFDRSSTQDGPSW